MSARVDVEDIQTTKGEKLLAVVLAGFLLLGGIWAYSKIDDAVRTASPPNLSYRGTPSDQAAIAAERRARDRLDRATRALAAASRNLVLKREAYRTAIEANRPSDELGREYDRAQATLTKAQAEVVAANSVLQAAEPAAGEAESHILHVQTGQEHSRELLAFALRLLFVLANLLFAYWLLALLRRRGSRYYPVGLAVVGYAAVLALVMAGDYLTDYVDPLDLGPLVLSVFGIALTLLAFVVLQRYLAKRIPYRRVRRSECPFCGYPVRGNEHCEGCGRDVVAACARCEEPRRVGSSFCGACGAA